MSDREEYMASVERVEARPAGGLESTAPLEKGPVQILCEEIGFKFDRRLERSDVLVAFVRELVSEIQERRDIAQCLAKGPFGTAAPSEGSTEVLALAGAMLAAQTDEERIQRADAVHEASWRLNPDEAFPTDHLIDMLSSCASAIRFGLEKPCHSRHAASAANHVWSQVYGVSRFDNYTPEWERDWARRKLISALIGMLPSSQTGNEGEAEAPGGQQ